MYLKNAWYVACTSDEIDGKPLGRTLCGDRIVLFRAEGGAVSRWRTSARTAARRCRSARCATTAASSAATTAW
jgi:hypothetical protein